MSISSRPLYIALKLACAKKKMTSIMYAVSEQASPKCLIKRHIPTRRMNLPEIRCENNHRVGTRHVTHQCKLPIVECFWIVDRFIFYERHLDLFRFVPASNVSTGRLAGLLFFSRRRFFQQELDMGRLVVHDAELTTTMRPNALNVLTLADPRLRCMYR